MKPIIFFSAFAIFIQLNAQIQQSIQKEDDSVSKPFVDYNYFKNLVNEVEPYRDSRLLNYEEWIAKSLEPNTVILDTRSQAMYDLKHVKGAIHLDFSDFTQFELDKIMDRYAGRYTQILIYCNNNFTDVGNKIDINDSTIIDQDLAFVTKMPISNALPKTNFIINTLALNIPTFINLYGYGYRNIYELNELVDVKDPRIAFEGTAVAEENFVNLK